MAGSLRYLNSYHHFLMLISGSGHKVISGQKLQINIVNVRMWKITIISLVSFPLFSYFSLKAEVKTGLIE